MKNGAVVVSASFGTVESYGQGLIQDYYNSLASADSQMDILVSGVITERSGAEADVSKKQYVSKFVKGSYYDKTVAKVAKSAYDKVAKQLDDEKTTLENVEAAKKYYEEAKTKIDAEYKKVVDAAKVDAKANIAKLYKAAPATMSATDVAAMKTEAEGKLESATTLQGIGEVIDSTTSFTSPILVGNYNEIERLRNNAFGSAKSAIDGIYAGDTSFDESLDKAAYATFKAQLAEYGITELPADVYAKYVKQISEAKSFVYYVDEDDETNYSVSKLEDEAVNAIQDSYDNILTAVRTSVLNSYYKEIDASKALTTDQAKVYCKGDVETAISEWFLAHSTDASVSSFLSYAANGGLNAVEAKLDEKYKAFQDERLASIKTSITTNLKAALAKVLDADDLYASICNAKIVGEKGVKSTDTGTIYADHAAAATALKISEALFDTVRDGATKDVDFYVNQTILKKTSGELDSITGADKTVTNYKTHESTWLANIATYAGTALSDFLTAVTSELNTTFGNGISTFAQYKNQGIADATKDWNKFSGTAVSLSDSFKDLFYDDAGKLVEGTTMTKINETVTNNNVSNWQGLAESLIYMYSYSVNKLTAKDASLTPYSVDDAGLYTQYKAALEGIVGGTITDYDGLVAAFDFAGGYKTSVAQALSDAKDVLQEQLNDLIKGTGHPLNVTVTKADYNAWLGIIGQSGYECSSVAKVLAWLSDASTSIAAVYGGGSTKSTLQGELDLIEAKSLAGKIIDAYVADEDNYTGTTMKYGIDENQEAADSYKEDVVNAVVYDGTTDVDAVADLVLGTGDHTLADLRKSTAKLAAGVAVIAKVTTDSYTFYKARVDILAAAVTGHTGAAINLADYIASITYTDDSKAMVKVLLPDYIQGIKDAADSSEVGAIFTNTSGTITGSITDLKDDATVLTTYKASLVKEFLSYVNEMVLENPNHAKEIRDFAAKVVAAAGAYNANIVVDTTLTITNLNDAATTTKALSDAWLTAVKGQINKIIA